MEPRHMKLKTQKVKWKGLLLATVLLLIGSGVAQAQVKVGGNIYGGGEKANVVGNDTVRIHGVHNDTILGNVYGGGLEGQVSGNAIVEMSSGVVGTPGQPTGTMNNGVAVCPVANGGRVFGGGKGSTTDHEHGLVEGNTFVTISGTAKVLMNVYGGGEMASVGSGNLNDKNSGVATVTIEGGEVGPLDGSAHNGYVFGGGKGLNDSNDAYWNFANVDSSSVVMTAGTVWGSLFGGSEDGHVIGDATLTYSGGTLGTNGKTSWDGNIFGGGRNYEAGNNTSGRVGGNVHVFVRGTAAVKGNVFGGGRLASVGIKRTSAENPAIVMQDGDDHGNIYVNILGGTIGLANLDTITSGTVVGGCMGDTIHTPGNINQSVLAHAKNTYVNILGGHVLANVYGGSAYGTVDEDAHVEIKGGEIGVYTVNGSDTIRTAGNVFGSGRGYAPETATNSGGFAYYANYGVVLKDTYVYVHDSIKESSTISSPFIHGIVYGGGEVASVGTYYATLEAGGTTHVKVTGGRIGPLDGTGLNAYVFGGSQGISGDHEEKYKYHATVGSTDIEIGENAMIDASVLGGGAEGHVWNDVNILIKGGTIGVDGVSLGAGHVYGGGGNMSESNQSAGRVGGNTHITMTAGTIKGGIYGGGYAGLVGVNGNGEMYTTDLSNHGNTLIEISNGIVGVDNGKGNVFGGGKGSETNYLFGNTANTDVRISGTAVIKGNVYGGGEMASVGHYTSSTLVEGTGVAKVTVSGGTVGAEITGPELVLSGSVFGGGLGKPTKAPNDYANFGNVDSTRVVVSGGYIVNSVYGGAENGHVFGNTDVLVKGGTIGKKLTLAERQADKSNQVVRIHTGNVYGGGSGATAIDSLNFGSTGYKYPVYSPTAGRVYGNTNVVVKAGTVRHAVYGGGNMSTIGTCDVNETTGLATYTSGGLATVTIDSVALIGPKRGDLVDGFSESEIDANFKWLGANEGYVFGSSRGLSGGKLKHLAFADSTIVTIDGNAQVISNVFGGGENGHVQTGTNVIVKGGIIGGMPLHGDTSAAITAYTDTLKKSEYFDITVHLAKNEGEITEDIYGSGDIVYRGNVFGGGKGTDSIIWQSPFKLCYTSGRVYGNTHVTVNDSALIYNKVYGGGAIASVGTFQTNNDSVIAIVGNTGHAYVTVSGGQIGIDGKNNGDVYGGGHGLPGRSKKEGEVLTSLTQPLTQVLHEAYVGHTHVVISDAANIKSNVYGGAANGHVQGDAHVTVDGGTIGIAGQGGWHSNIYGGGGGARGYTDSNGKTHLSISAGRVFGDTYVTINDGHIYHGVYGGGAIASVGTYILGGENPSIYNGNSYVNVYGGTIGTDGNHNGDVYGSGRGVACAPNEYPDSLSYLVYTNINIGKDGTVGPIVKGSVYGSGENGHVFKNTVVNVYSGTVEQNVFGAGSGSDTYMDHGVAKYNPIGGIVQGNTFVNIRGGYVNKSVYGGGEMASVGTLNYTGSETVGTGHTQVTISGGRVGLESVTQEAGQEGYVFGGSLGHVAADSLGCVASTEVIVNNDGYLTNSLFGGGKNSRVLHDAVVNISGGTVGRALTLAERKVEANVRKVYTGNVYGGGSGNSRDALGNYNASAGVVAGNTEVTISGGTVRHNVYGGGALATVGTWSTDESGAWTVGDGTGVAKVTINGNALIGPKLEDLLSENQAEIDSNFKYLGVNEGHVFGSSRGWVDQECDNMAFTDSTHVTISGNAQVVSGVFGGGANGHVLHGTNVCIAGGTIGGLPLHEGTKNLKDLVPSTSPYYHATHFVNLKPEDSEIAEDATYGTGVRRIARGSVFGGGRGYDTITGSGRYNPVAGRVYGNTRVTVTDGNIYNKVYGGGTLASVGVYNYDATVTDSIVSNTRGGKAEVFIEGGTIGTNGLNNGDVYGGGLGIAAKDRTQPTYLAYVNKTDVQISNGATIKNSVYGGPACGHVLGNTKVTVSGGTIGIQGNGGWHSNVYGGGGGAERYKIAGKPDHLSISAGRVFGNTEVNIEGGTIYHNVYGGGAIASVGKYDLSGSVPTYISDGYTTVNITSGTIGYDGNENGMVFGSARGQIDAAGTFLDSLSYVAYSVVNIGSGTVNPSTGEASSLAGDAVIKGSVYGSGENGHTYLESKVNVFSGTIGCTASEYASMSAYDKEHLFPLRGNVYGAGCGTDTDVHGDYNPQAGVTQGNTFVNIYGGNISHNVYGGGAMARVGIIQNTNKATVELRGGNIGLEAASTTSGFIYGSSRGTNSNFDAELAYCANTEVNIRNGSYFTVYGGGENGQVKYNTKVNVHNGEVQHTIYGGGQGVFGDDGHTWDTVPGRIMGNTEVNLIAGTVNNIYGGSRSSNIWGNVEVNVGTVTQAVDPGDLPTYEGNTTINGNIYGANNKNGAPFGDIDVNIYGTAHVTEQPNADTVPNTPTGGWTPEALIANAAIQKYAIDTVFGGGNHANYAHYELGRGSSGGSQTTVHVYGCQNTICELYGGSNASDIGSPTVTNRNDANVIVDGGRIHRVFGGGNGSVDPANIWGWANTTINAGIIDTVFGGSNMNGSILNTNLVFTHEGTCPEYILDIYGGSNEAPIVGDVTTTLACGEGNYYEFYGGARNANIYGNVTLNVEGGEVENLFGGSCGTVDKPANISKVTEAIHAQYPVYPVNYGGNVTLNLYGGKHTNVFGGSNVNGNIEGVITVNVIDKETTNCELDITNLYGGSKQTAITSTTVDTVSPVVNVIHIAQEPGIRGNVFGGSLGDTATVTSNPQVNIGYEAASMAAFIPKDKDNNPLYIVPTNPHALVSGDVYGGGSLAIVHGNTEVNMLHDDAVVEGNIFGAGMGIDKDADTAKVIGSSSVNIATGWAKRSIFGGGNKASVDGDTYVVVSGGTIGKKLTLRQRYVDDRSLHNKVDDGDVYGGGEGVSSNVGDYKKLGRVYGNTNVTVNGNAVVRHNVYGGGRMASVGTFTMNDAGTITNWTDGTGTATVTIGGNALIGPKKADLTENISADELADAALVVGVSSLTVPEYIDAAFKYLGGNEGVIYGSGRGKPEPSFNWAAYVKETSVSIEDNAQVVGGVFGGGENGRVYQNTEVTIGSGTGTDEFVIGGLPLHGTSYALSQVPTTNEYYDASLTIHLSEADSEIAEDEFGVGRRVMRGQVFGGGRGTDTYPNPYNSSAPALYNPIGGSVFGNTLTTIKGGKIYNNVYGGGTIASVGTFTYSPSVTDSIVGYAAGTGTTEIVINGG